MHLPSILLYMSSSMAIVICNKIILTNYNFPSIPYLMFLQSLLAICVYRSSLEQRPNRYVLISGLCNLANVLSGLAAAGTLNVAMFGALRKLSIIMTMISQWVIFRSRPSKWTMVSILGIVIGAFIAGMNDLAFDARGYTYVMVNNICTVASQMANKLALEKNVDKGSLLFYNAFITVVGTSVLSIHFSPGDFEHWGSYLFRFVLLGSLILGLFLNWSVAWLLEKNDPLTLSVAGSIKSSLNGLIVCVGLFDPTYIFSWKNFIGLQITAASSFMYIFTR